MQKTSQETRRQLSLNDPAAWDRYYRRNKDSLVHYAHDWLRHLGLTDKDEAEGVADLAVARAKEKCGAYDSEKRMLWWLNGFIRNAGFEVIAGEARNVLRRVLFRLGPEDADDDSTPGGSAIHLAAHGKNPSEFIEYMDNRRVQFQFMLDEARRRHCAKQLLIFLWAKVNGQKGKEIAGWLDVPEQHVWNACSRVLCTLQRVARRLDEDDSEETSDDPAIHHGSCPAVAEIEAHAYADAPLPRERDEWISAHVRGCKFCQIWFQAAKQNVDLLRAGLAEVLAFSNATEIGVLRPKDQQDARFADALRRLHVVPGSAIDAAILEQLQSQQDKPRRLAKILLSSEDITPIHANQAYAAAGLPFRVCTLCLSHLEVQKGTFDSVPCPHCKRHFDPSTEQDRATP